MADVCAPAGGEPGFQLGVRRLARLVRGKEVQLEKRCEVDGRRSVDVYMGGVQVWGCACQ